MTGFAAVTTSHILAGFASSTGQGVTATTQQDPVLDGTLTRSMAQSLVECAVLAYKSRSEVRHLQHLSIVIAETGADAKLLDGDRLRSVQMTEQSLQVTSGIEITAPQAVPLPRLNRLLADLGEALLAGQEYKPVRAA